MINTKQVKEAAALVGAIAGIVTGIEKVRTTVNKWASEYKERKDATRTKEIDRAVSSDEQRS